MNQVRKHILFVDDDPDTCEIIRLVLGGYRYEVTTAGTAADALRLAGGGDFDLYILDNRLPDESGIRLCHFRLVFFNAR